MLGRLSASALLKSVIAVMATAIMVMLAVNAWESWTRLAGASRITAVAEASGHAFKALHRLRSDRARTGRILAANEPAAAELLKDIDDLRSDEVPSLRAALGVLRGVDFPDRDAALMRLDRLIGTLASLQTETRAAMTKPKDARGASLGKDYTAVSTEILEFVETLTGQLTAMVKGEDAFVDQMLSIKQLVWNARSAGGNAALSLSNGLAAGTIDAEGYRRYLGHAGGVVSAWSAVEDAATGARTPAALLRSLAVVKAGYLGAEYTGARDRAIEALFKGEKPQLNVNQWTTYNGTYQDTVVNAAVDALDAATAAAADRQAAAWRGLTVSGLLLAATMALAIGSMIAIGRRVITPLGQIKEAMLRLAGGDLSAETPYADRRDEIGGLASAFGTFRQNAIEKERIEDEQRQARTAQDQRTVMMERAIREFEVEISRMLTGVMTASTGLNGTAREMSEIAAASTRKAGEVAVASQQASANVQTVAAASEELSRSIQEIGLQVTTSRSIARQAVSQAEQTNTTVNGLVEASSRVGEIVGLINSIASQTNLLALNATIEAARAGEAGKGFAVVAQEVKNLAAQTASATDQIAQQIQAMQTISTDAAQALKGIGTTIVRIDEIATGIAAAVEEQHAATAEIARNVEEAARGTEKVSGNIADVTEAADQTGDAAHRVLEASGDVAGQAEVIRTQVAGFLQRIRAA